MTISYHNFPHEEKGGFGDYQHRREMLRLEAERARQEAPREARKATDTSLMNHAAQTAEALIQRAKSATPQDAEKLLTEARRQNALAKRLLTKWIF